MAEPAAATLDVGAVIPDVKGTSLAELAPEKAGVAVGSAGLAVATVLLGFKTLELVSNALLACKEKG